MKRHVPAIVALLVLLTASGCANMDKFVKSLAKDGAIVNADIKTLYGMGHLTRIGTTTNEVKITAPDGTIYHINPSK